MSLSLRESIARQREVLADMLAVPLARLAQRCSAVWPEREGLNRVLAESLSEFPQAIFLYCVDTQGVQVCDNISRRGALPEHFGRDRSTRPYMSEVVPARDFLLSETYISLRATRPSLTALQLVRCQGRVAGFVGVDFDLRDLPLTRELYAEPDHWRQIRGDPAIRGQVFLQCRVESLLDQHVDEVLAVLEELIEEHGVFHLKIHFSSSRATLWLLEDPYRYRLLGLEELTDPDVCLAYPRHHYPADATLPVDAIRPVLSGFRALRLMDETLYLRSASLNIFNAMVSLTFSCDGSHYMRYDEFLAKDLRFWTGTAAAG